MSTETENFDTPQVEECRDKSVDGDAIVIDAEKIKCLDFDSAVNVVDLNSNGDGNAIIIIPIQMSDDNTKLNDGLALATLQNTAQPEPPLEVEPVELEVNEELEQAKSTAIRAAIQLAGHISKQEYTCDECGKIFGGQANFVRHMQKTHGVEIEFPQKEFTCQECGKSFSLQSSLKRHKLIHCEGEISYECSLCPKSFHYRSSVRRHEKTQHKEEETNEIHPCEKCSKTFMYATSLQRHMKTHLAKEIYPCGHCTRCFEYLSSLRRHEKLHVQGKLFQCAICQRDFGYLSSLTRHMRTHEKSLICGICNKTFRLEKSYTKHILSHNSQFTSQVDDKDINVQWSVAHMVNNTSSETIGSMDEDIEIETAVKTTQDIDRNIKNESVNDTVSLEQIMAKTFTSRQEGTITNKEYNAQDVSIINENIEGLDESNQQEQDNENTSEDSLNDSCGTFQQGIMVVEVDSDGRTIENKLEAFQSTNLLQLLQAVEGITSGESANHQNKQ